MVHEMVVSFPTVDYLAKGQENWHVDEAIRRIRWGIMTKNMASKSDNVRLSLHCYLLIAEE